MRSDTRRSVGKAASARSVSSDPGFLDPPGPPGPKSPNRLSFWRRRRTVTPSALPSLSQRPSAALSPGPSPPSPISNDPNDNIIFLNNPTEFDLRSLFFRRPKPNPLPSSSDKSGISYGSSASSHRNYGNGSAPVNTVEPTHAGTKTEVVDPTNASVAPAKTKLKRRLRAKEELCIVLPKSTARGRSRSQKSWFLGPGFIGREHAEGTIVATKDPTMDAVHAEVSIAGDDYLVRDAQSTRGTFLCLSTRYRHYPQRDGFRLRQGDVFRIGPATSVRVVELRTTATDMNVWSPRDKRNAFKPDTAKAKIEAKTQPRVLERTSSTSSSGSGTGSPRNLKRLSTVEELRLVAADVEDEFKDIISNTRETKTPQKVTGDTENEEKAPEAPSPSPPRRSVRFADTPPVMSDGSVFLGSRYIRQEIKQHNYHEPSEMEDDDDDVIKQLIGSELEHTISPRQFHSRHPDFIRLVVFQHDPSQASVEPTKPREAREIILPGQKTYLIGSSPACDVRIFPSEGIEVRPVHARITFDGSSFVLQDLSFERDLRRQTRVLLNQRPVKITRGDWLLLGRCALHVTTVARAFGSERRPDVKEAAMRLNILRLSKRKPRTRGIFLPVGFRLHSTQGSGASSGASGWGGSSGGPVIFGKGRECDAQVFSATLAIEQFSVQLERGTCLLTPKPAGINAGTYFLIGRDELGQETTSSVDPLDVNDVDIIKQTSKPLLLSETCVFRCGGCELEVIYTKTRSSAADLIGTAVIEEQEHVQLLSTMPWLQQIAHDQKLISNLARCGQRLQLNTGDVIYEKGDSANFLFREDNTWRILWRVEFA